MKNWEGSGWEYLIVGHKLLLLVWCSKCITANVSNTSCT